VWISLCTNKYMQFKKKEYELGKKQCKRMKMQNVYKIHILKYWYYDVHSVKYCIYLGQMILNSKGKFWPQI
jgi:hypothetical protein